MPQPRLSLEWKCRRCPWGSVENVEQIVARLRSIGMLARETPDDATLMELAKAASDRLPCPECQQTGLTFEVALDDDPDVWGDPIPCELCGELIPAERLEVFPSSKVCARCQAKLDRGEQAGPLEYCPRCGSPMTLRLSRGSGITRYQWVCSLGTQCRR